MQQRWGLPIVAWPSRLRPNFWDLVALPLVLGAIILIAWASRQMNVPYQAGEALPISLDPRNSAGHTGCAPCCAWRWRSLASLGFSLAYAALAAKSRRAEKLLIPVLDILQSVPILGFLSITVTGFIALFPGKLLGYECAAIFAIFTSQAWNMTFSLYQSFIGVPQDLREAARMYHLSPWQSFWQLEVPYALPQPRLEHDDVGVRRLVLRRRLRGDQRRRAHRAAAGHRLLHRASRSTSAISSPSATPFSPCSSSS